LEAEMDKKQSYIKGQRDTILADVSLFEVCCGRASVGSQKVALITGTLAEAYLRATFGIMSRTRWRRANYGFGPRISLFPFVVIHTDVVVNSGCPISLFLLLLLLLGEGDSNKFPDFYFFNCI
jgi:hypothetical protein